MKATCFATGCKRKQSDGVHCAHHATVYESAYPYLQKQQGKPRFIVSDALGIVKHCYYTAYHAEQMARALNLNFGSQRFTVQHS